MCVGSSQAPKSGTAATIRSIPAMTGRSCAISASARGVVFSPVRATDEDLVAEQAAQPCQAGAHGWLADVEPFCRPAYMPLFQQRLERHKKVEVEPTEIHGADVIHNRTGMAA